MDAKQSENPDDRTHSGPVPSDIATVEYSSSLQNVETDKDIHADIDNLYEAAVEGKIEDFKEYNKKKPLDQLVTPNKNTILHIHITARDIPRAQNNTWIHKLIDKLFPDAQKTAQSKKESSLKFVEGILDMCPDLLLQVNIKVETPLHIAARHGHDDIVELLIWRLKETHQNDQEQGVGQAREMLRMKNKAGDTALHEAVRFNHKDVIGRLLQEDPDYSYGANDADETPLYLAAERGYFDIVKKMASPTGTPSAERGYHGPIGRTALHAAVIRGDLGITKMILEKKETLREIKDEEGWIPLHYAAYYAYYGYIGIVKELLGHDNSTAYIKTDKEEKTALHIAASRGNVDIMKELISRCPGCSELVDKRGWNVFHFAIESRNREAIKVVLENPSLGNLINECNCDGNTPLHQLATLGLKMTSFIDHPKVDELAFNKKNLNALDITLNEDVRTREQKYLMYWLKEKRFREGQRFAVNKDVCNGKGKGSSSDDKKGKKKVSDDDQKEKKKPSDDDQKEKKKHSDDDKKEKKKGSDLIDNIDEKKGAHLVVATLIATVTFAAGFTVPGGYKDEGSPDQGTALLRRSAAFKVFVITDTIAMMLSSSAVIFHLFMALDREKGRLISHFIIELQFIIWATFFMVIAFVTGTYTILAPSSALAIAACVLGCLFFLFYVYFTSEFIFDFLDLLSEKVTSVRSRSCDVFTEIRILGFLCREVVRKVLSK